jgi:hypothetical protein
MVPPKGWMRIDAAISELDQAIREIRNAVPLAPDEQAGEHATWLSALRARAAQVGVDVVIEPVPGGTRFACELPVGA